MDLKSRVAIVTGSSRGIGAATALKLSRAGADVVINYHSESSSGKAEEVAAKVEEAGSKSLLVRANVADPDDAKRLAKETLDQFGKIDILVNNAGITRDNLFLRMKKEDWQKVIDVNLTGVYNCIKAVIRPMMKKRYGRIINLSSVVGISGNAGQANYAASKAGIIGLTKSLARELAKRGITVNAVAPGFIESDMTSDLPEKVKEEMLASIPQARFGQPEDVANLISFLASSEADYITGQIINVDGGMNM